MPTIKQAALSVVLFLCIYQLSACSNVPISSTGLQNTVSAEVVERYNYNKKVASALNELHRNRGAEIKSLLSAVGLTFPLAEIQLIALKDSRQIEVWGKNTHSAAWVYIKTYPFTGYSGKLGPKLREGDKQIPEGIYNIPSINPQSNYHLSLFVDYPNKFDLTYAFKDRRTNLGGEIFIHGSDKTVGCIPVGDYSIEELFYLVGWTKETNANVIIAPYDLRVLPISNSTSLYWVSLLYAEIKKALIPFHHQ